MIEPGVREAREVGILGKYVNWCDVFLKLYQEAVLADARDQRIKWLHGVELLSRQETLAQRRHAEIDKFYEVAIAEPAACISIRLARNRCARHINHDFPWELEGCRAAIMSSSCFDSLAGARGNWKRF